LSACELVRLLAGVDRNRLVIAWLLKGSGGEAAASHAHKLTSSTSPPARGAWFADIVLAVLASRRMTFTIGVWRRLILGIGALAAAGAAAVHYGAGWPLRGRSADGADQLEAVATPAGAAMPTPPTQVQSARPVPASGRPPVSDTEQRAFLLASARTAWAYVQRNYHQGSGLVGATDQYQFVTIWDVGSTLGAYLAGRELGFITPEDYRARVSRVLRTLESLALHDDAAFNRLYAASSGRMLGRNEVPSTRGYGWSATDLGRLLLWLKIVAVQDSEHAAVAERIVDRLDADRLVRDGYLRGQELTPSGRRRGFQEGRVGYEQYAAAGFALWGIRAERALDLRINGTPVTVLGHTILGDRRGDDLLTSEPVVLMGLELGWPSPQWEQLAREMLAVQEERHRRTGLVTIVSEDAVPRPPAYFYYYLLHRNGEDFVVLTPSHDLVPWNLRWVSAKAAFAWHALMPSAYTWLALQTVRPAGTPDVGWSAGVYERSKVPVPSNNLNTAAVILEATAYFMRGCPLIVTTAACPTAGVEGASSGKAEAQGR
jgi:Protein of unknown function (DUF3131)